MIFALFFAALFDAFGETNAPLAERDRLAGDMHPKKFKDRKKIRRRRILNLSVEPLFGFHMKFE